MIEDGILEQNILNHKGKGGNGVSFKVRRIKLVGSAEDSGHPVGIVGMVMEITLDIHSCRYGIYNIKMGAGDFFCFIDIRLQKNEIEGGSA